MKNPYETLGVDKDATQEEITKAFKEKAKKSHPDKETGNKEKFQEHNMAVSIIGDVVKREKFDKTGKTGEDSFEKKFASFLARGLAEIQNCDDIKHLDLMGIYNLVTEKAMERFKDDLRKTKRIVLKYKVASKRAKRKYGDTKNNILKIIIDAQIDTENKRVIQLEEDIEFIKKVVEALGDYEFEFEQRQESELSRALRTGATIHFNV